MIGAREFLTSSHTYLLALIEELSLIVSGFFKSLVFLELGLRNKNVSVRRNSTVVSVVGQS
jgi:hypothetical protein